MALVECPECKKEVSSEAAACPHCGFALHKEKRSGWGKEIGLLLLVPIGILVALFLIFLVKEIVSPTDLSKSPTWAISQGKESLEHSLKDPDSVEYGDVWAGTLKSDKGSVLVACGYFNARNSFGGMTGQQRFIGSPGGIAFTSEIAGGVFDTMWQQACVQDRVW
jgi:hypothetical protein